MSDIFDEIDEELRKDKMTAWWKKNAAAIIIGCVLSVGGVAGYKFWQNLEVQNANEAGIAYAKALRTAQNSGGDKTALNALIAQYPESVGVLAEFTKAVSLAGNGQVDQALGIYDKIAAMPVDEIFKQLAVIRAGYLRIDTEPLSNQEAKMGPMNSEANPWRQNAREILGMSAWRVGDVKKAHDYFNQILADRNSSPGIYQRAQFMAALIAPKMK